MNDFKTEWANDSFIEYNWFKDNIKLYQPVGEYCEYEMMLNYNSIMNQDQYLVNNTVREGKTVIDCGANIGMYSLYCMFKGANVYAFEPNPIAFKALSLMWDNNREIIERTYSQIINKAVSDATEMITLDMSGIFTGTSHVVTERKGNGSFHEVDAIRIDDFVNLWALSSVDIIKVDVEGHEDKVLYGAAETLRNHKPDILISAYHNIDDKVRLKDIIKDIYSGYGIAYCENEFTEPILFAKAK